MHPPEPITAEVALYPLREPEIAPLLLDFIQALRDRGLEVRAGPMSSLIIGPPDRLFAALGEAFTGAAQGRQVVLRAVFSNAAPPPQDP